MLTSTFLPTALCSYMLASSFASASTFAVDFKKEVWQTKRSLTPRGTAEAQLIELPSDIAYLIEFEIGTPPQARLTECDLTNANIR